MMNNILLRHCHRHLQTRIRYSAGARISTKTTTATAVTTTSTTTATTTIRSFSSNNDNKKPKKLSEDEIKASLRLLSYQGTPFPWAAVSFFFVVTSTYPSQSQSSSIKGWCEITCC